MWQRINRYPLLLCELVGGDPRPETVAPILYTGLSHPHHDPQPLGHGHVGIDAHGRGPIVLCSPPRQLRPRLLSLSSATVFLSCSRSRFGSASRVRLALPSRRRACCGPSRPCGTSTADGWCGRCRRSCRAGCAPSAAPTPWHRRRSRAANGPLHQTLNTMERCSSEAANSDGHGRAGCRPPWARRNLLRKSPALTGHRSPWSARSEGRQSTSQASADRDELPVKSRDVHWAHHRKIGRQRKG